MALTRPMLRRDGDRWRLHYDPAIGAAAAQTSRRRSRLPARPHSGPPTTRSACPTLLLRGADSDVLAPATAEAMAARGPKARVHEFAGVGHAPTLVAADQVAVVREFLQADALNGRARPRHENRFVASTSAPRADRSPARGPGRGARRRRRGRARARLRRAADRRPRAADRRGRARARRRRRRDPAPRSAPAPTLCAAAYLVHAADELGDPDAVLTKLFGASQAALVAHARKLGVLQRAAQGAQLDAARARAPDRARAQDAARVLARPARRPAAAGVAPADAALLRGEPAAVPGGPRRRGDAGVRAARQPARHLADQVGARGPGVPLPRPRAATGRIARLLDERRVDREARVAAMRAQPRPTTSRRTACAATVQGRPKHLYSIWKKMQRQGPRLRPTCSTCIALRVIVADVAACYAVLGRVHERFRAIAGEFDDYIARPKANGYRSLHTVVEGDDGRAVEIQIRTRRDARARRVRRLGALGLQGGRRGKRCARRQRRRRVRGQASRRRAWSCCASCSRGSATWRATASPTTRAPTADDAAMRVRFDDRIYVFTPQAALVELRRGRDADRLRLRGPHRPRPPLPRRAASTARSCRSTRR